MSKIKGLIPLFLATSFGIINGIWVFQPLLAAQQEGLDEQIKKSLDAADQPKEHHANAMQETQAAASRNSATEPALKPIPSTNSWWSNISFPSKSESAGVDTSSTGPRIEAMKGTKERKEENT
ncbi:hypothetical protein NA56DRAFT_702489 [Hyaloscypha hepaticicola]|uniref:Uncharacterized protein n=1 Tax=Hyaloscypha hepaticicola TaxID=2082293 RepID=A0A2J6Q8W6_9HELO|nr:hypothetical protein NA56DRAFT_702489 [Hyaloscypha hepaticicola]